MEVKTIYVYIVLSKWNISFAFWLTQKSLLLKVDMLHLNPGDFKSSVCFSERLTSAYTQTLFKNREKKGKERKN